MRHVDADAMAKGNQRTRTPGSRAGPELCRALAIRSVGRSPNSSRPWQVVSAAKGEPMLHSARKPLIGVLSALLVVAGVTTSGPSAAAVAPPESVLTSSESAADSARTDGAPGMRQPSRATRLAMFKDLGLSGNSSCHEFRVTRSNARWGLFYGNPREACGGYDGVGVVRKGPGGWVQTELGGSTDFCQQFVAGGAASREGVPTAAIRDFARYFGCSRSTRATSLPRIPTLYDGSPDRDAYNADYCSSAGPGGDWTGVRPSEIPNTCMGNHWSFDRLTWVSWTPKRAAGRGDFHYNDCTPSCMEGTWRTKRGIRVVLSKPVSSRDSGRTYFSQWSFSTRLDIPPLSPPD